MRRTTSSSAIRPALVGVATVVLLGLVAFASRSDQPFRTGDPDVRALPAAFWDYAATLGLIALFVLLLLAVYLMVPGLGPRAGGFGFSRLATLIILAALVTYAGTRTDWAQRLRGDVSEAQPDESLACEQLLLSLLSRGVEADVPPMCRRYVRQTARRTEKAAEEDRSVQLQWQVVFVLGGLALLGLAIYLVRRRIEVARRLEAPGDAASALSAALDESVDDLRGERDARRAVIAAYARMERTLGWHGFPRFRAEAPLEYLSRVLRVLRVRSEAVLALTELFERAKFSRHEIDADMKEEAIGALIAVRDDLRAT